MNKLSKIVGTVCISLMGSIGSANADASAFTGAYVAVTGSAIGMAMDGTRTKTVDTYKTTKGAIGMVSPAVGAEVGFSYPLTDMFFITAGGSYQPFDANVNAKGVDNGRNVKLETSDIMSLFIEPSFNVTENSAFFIKIGHSDSDVNVTGTDVEAEKSYDISGTTIAIGTKTIADNGMFLKTEAGMTDYDSITLTGISEEANDTTAEITYGSSIKADVEVAYGQVTVGYKF